MERQPKLASDSALASVLNSPAELRLQEAIERLTTVFGGYEKPPLEHCVDTQGAPIPDEKRIAWAKSPWEYRPCDMDLIWHSFFVWMRPPAGHDVLARTVKYWLPRLLYGLAGGEAENAFDADVIADKLTRADWLNWPHEEAAAVRSWCAAWLQACIESDATEDHVGYGPGCRSVSACLLFAVAIGLDLTFVLAEAVNTLRPRDVSAIEDVVVVFTPQVICRDRLANAADPRVAALRALLRWMFDPATSERLEAAFYRAAETNKALARQISNATDCIANVRKSYSADPLGLPDWLSR